MPPGSVVKVGWAAELVFSSVLCSAGVTIESRLLPQFPCGLCPKDLRHMETSA